jgi:hypothetical protein
LILIPGHVKIVALYVQRTGEIRMKYSRSVLRSVMLAGLLLFVLAREAHAYIDPGTGSYVLRLVVAVPLGAAVAVRVYWKRIGTFCSGLFSRGEEMQDGS